jgi:hypothetical protein
VDEFADAVENRFGEIGGLGDVTVHARVFVWHGLKLSDFSKEFNLPPFPSCRAW